MSTLQAAVQIDPLDAVKQLYQYAVPPLEHFSDKHLGPRLDQSQESTVESMADQIVRYGEGNIAKGVARAVAELALRLIFKDACLVRKDLSMGDKIALDRDVIFVHKDAHTHACLVIKESLIKSTGNAFTARNIDIIRFAEGRVSFEEGFCFLPNNPNSRNRENSIRRCLGMSKMEKLGLSPPTYCMFESGTDYFYIQERMNMTLQEYSDRLYRLPPSRLHSIAIQVVHCIASLHESGIIHRDVKFDNILVKITPDGEKIYLIDYEFSCLLSDTNALKQIPGSIPYIPPDYFQSACLKEDGPFSPSPALDMWPLGIILFFLYFKKTPDLYHIQCEYNLLLQRIDKVQRAVKKLRQKLEPNQLLPGEIIDLFENCRLVEKDLATLDHKECLKCAESLEAELKSLTEKKSSLITDWKFCLRLLPERPNALETLGDLAIAMLQADPNRRLTAASALNLLKTIPTDALFAPKPATVDPESPYMRYLEQTYDYHPEEIEPFSVDRIGEPLAEEEIQKAKRYVGEIADNRLGLCQNTALAVYELAKRLHFTRACMVEDSELKQLEGSQRHLTSSVLFLREEGSLFAFLIDKDPLSSKKILQQKRILLIRFSHDGVTCQQVRGFFPNSVKGSDLHNMIRRNYAMRLMEPTHLAPRNFCHLKCDTSYFFIQEEMQTDLQMMSDRLTTLRPSTLHRISQDIVKSILHLHRNGIIHRDIKFDNFLVQSQNGEVRVYITDFEFSCSLEDRMALRLSVGTVPYIPPERFRHVFVEDGTSFTYSKAYDVWAIGLILYYVYHKRAHPLHEIQFQYYALSKKISQAEANIRALRHKQETGTVLEGFETVKVTTGSLNFTGSLATVDASKCTHYIQLLTKHITTLGKQREETQEDWLDCLNELSKKPKACKTLGDIACAMLQADPNDRLPLDEAERLLDVPTHELFGAPSVAMPPAPPAPTQAMDWTATAPAATEVAERTLLIHPASQVTSEEKQIIEKMQKERRCCACAVL